MTTNSKLLNHGIAVANESIPFENVFESLERMIFERGIEKVNNRGKKVIDYKIFREDPRPIVKMYNTINDLVHFIKNAAEGGATKEMGFALIGEPGCGKTNIIDFLMRKYRNFLTEDRNRKYTFRFINLQELEGYGTLKSLESQTYEDPMILLMNLFESQDENKRVLQENCGFSDSMLEHVYRNYRPLGADSEYVLSEIREKCNGNLPEMLDFIDVVPVPISESRDTITSQFIAKDKITSSGADLLGEEDTQRMLQISDPNNPARLNLRKGAIAPAAGGGIHFADEIFRNKRDLVAIYLGIVQDRQIVLEGHKWPLDTFIVGTSNNDVYNNFLQEKEEAPITNRFTVHFVPHNTNYQEQKKLTEYSLGTKQKYTVDGNKLHIDPNLNMAASIAVVLTRLPQSQKLTPEEMMKLDAGEVAGEKSVKTLNEIINELERESDVTKRYGQRGLGQRDLSRAFQFLSRYTETNDNACMFAYDVFYALEKVILDYITDSAERQKYLERLDIARQEYRKQVRSVMYDAYMDEPDAIRKDVLAYVNMVIGMYADELGPDNMWSYKDPNTGEYVPLKIDKRFIEAVENRYGLTNASQKESFRTTIYKIYGQKINSDPDYDFMDNTELVKAVADVKLESDIAGAGSLVGALSNTTNKENKKLYDRITDTMINKLGFCDSCAFRTIQYFCTKQDEN